MKVLRARARRVDRETRGRPWCCFRRARRDGQAAAADEIDAATITRALTDAPRSASVATQLRCSNHVSISNGYRLGNCVAGFCRRRFFPCAERPCFCRPGRDRSVGAVAAPARAHAHSRHPGLSVSAALHALPGAVHIRVSRAWGGAPMHLLARIGKPAQRSGDHAANALLVGALIAQPNGPCFHYLSPTDPWRIS